MSFNVLQNSKFSKISQQKKCSCRKCRCTKYVPVTTPRMNIYSVRKDIWFNDLREYNDHRKKCFYAKSSIDNKPCLINLKERLNAARLEGDCIRARNIDVENKKMLKMFIAIERFGGPVNTVNSKVNIRQSKRLANESQMLYIDKENKLMYKRLQEVKSRYSYDPKEWKHWKNELKNSANFPFILFKKRNLDKSLRTEPSISSGLNQVDIYIHCFMDFKVHKGEYLGRVIILLYYFFEPLLVQHFSRSCSELEQPNYKNCLVHRIVKNKYLEAGNVAVKSNFGTSTAVYEGKFNHMNNKLKHTKTGTLSMVREKNLKYTSKFCITFQPMEQLDRRNIVIGKIVSGADVLMKINGYGRKIGKPLIKIVISNCGQLTENI
ncbi:hypothetical protein WA026_018116 [Henosepilachna vigintioctopunctata]|uniref:PPIase cyclophilin-type domain-containing protein n=1 Tax=Henosepilachna vigintioctopunctata TaxID=420089 RepID=A0AAW1UE44_9CUCU